jgi:hypothetical protein
MANRSRLGLVCFAFLVVFFIAVPWNSHPATSEKASAFLTRADSIKEDAGSADNRENCVVAPDQAKGTTPDPLPIEQVESRPNFDKNRKEAVLSLIHYPWEDLGFKVVLKGSRLGYRAMTLTGRQRIELYVRPGENAWMQAFDLAHEFGHAFDLKYNNGNRHRKWCELRGIDPSTPWFGCDACPDYGTPAGDFAETFAYLLLGPGSYHSTMAPAPKADQVQELAKFCKIEHIAEALNRILNKNKNLDVREQKPAEIQASRKDKPGSQISAASEPAADPVQSETPDTSGL